MGEKKVCHYVAQIYQDVLDLTSVRSQCQNNAKQGLKELPLTSSAGGPEEIFVGVSCCQRPEGLGSLWDAHRRATLAALSTGLQGLHGELRDAGDLVVEGSKLTVTVNSSVESFETDRGHFWRLLPAGKQVVEVKGEGFTPVTKLITIIPGDLAVSVINLLSRDSSSCNPQSSRHHLHHRRLVLRSLQECRTQRGSVAELSFWLSESKKHGSVHGLRG